MVGEHRAVAPVAEERAAQFANVCGRCHPARRFQINRFQLLQRAVLFFIENLHAHVIRHFLCTRLRRMFLASRPCLLVEAAAAAALGAFRCAVDEGDRVLFQCDDIRFTSRLFHHLQRLQFLGVLLQLRRDRRPLHALVAVHVLLEAGLERF